MTRDRNTFSRRAARRNSRNNSGCAVFLLASASTLIALASIAAGFVFAAVS